MHSSIAVALMHMTMAFHGTTDTTSLLVVFCEDERVTMTRSIENGAITLSRMNFSEYVGHVTIFT